MKTPTKATKISDNTPPVEERIEETTVKHTFSMTEREAIGSDLARALGQARGIAAEFDQIKASFKARTAEAEATIENLSTALSNGFDYRKKRCRVVLDHNRKKKLFFLEEDINDGAKPVLEQDMTQEDFQCVMPLGQEERGEGVSER